MASQKRKAVVADKPSKRVRSGADATPSSKQDDPEPSATKQAKVVHEVEDVKRKPARTSILQNEERAFPRGGGSLLTPLEHKQIKLDAERDVLFEQTGKQKPSTDGLYDEADDDDGVSKELRKSKVDKKRRKDSGKKSTNPSEASASHVKIQGLSYKNLVVGSLVLGQVQEITSQDVALALPNNLTGFVPLTAISQKLNQRIEAILDDDAKAPVDTKNEDYDEDDETSDDIDLQSLFRIGQYLRGYVVSTGDETVTHGIRKTKRRIEVSVDPSQANIGLSSLDLTTNMMVQASVRSVEDHGLIMDLGFDDSSTTGFIAKNALGKDWDISKMQEGQVLLCAVTGKASNGGVVKLSPDVDRIGDASKHFLTSASTVDAFVPGTAVELLVAEAGSGGLSGKIMGMLDATADMLHSGAGGRGIDIEEKYKVGQKVHARILCTFPTSEDKKVGVSLLDHVKLLQEHITASKSKAKSLRPSQIIEEVTITQVEPTMGVFLDIGAAGRPGFAHISRISDKKIESLTQTTGPYKVGSTHRARILNFNPVDGVYNVSLEQSTLDQPFLRLADVKIGQIVRGKLDKMILGPKGVTGVLMQLAEGISGLIPEIHFADVHLEHPEKKLREGFPVTARVLNVDLEKRQIRLTLKKTLLNTDLPLWKNYKQISAGDRSLGTIVNLLPKGAVLQFYGNIRAWLPVAEMSEAFISDPSQHFRMGQTVTVRVLSIDAEAGEMKVSCKEPSIIDEDQQKAWDAVVVGTTLGATVSELNEDSLTLKLDGSELSATLKATHLAEGSGQKAQSMLKHLRLGQKLSDLLVLDKKEQGRQIVLSNKASLVKAAKAGSLVTSFDNAIEGAEVSGFVRNITPDGVFVEFANGAVGYLPKALIPQEALAQPSFGLKKDQSLSARIQSRDPEQRRFALTLKKQKVETPLSAPPPVAEPTLLTNPVDGISTSVADYTLNKTTQARITSVKDTQLNVQLADNIQGRVDVSEVFNTWEDIKDVKRPLSQFKTKDVLAVRIMGIHDARNHRFLPITHRQSRVPVFELSAKSGKGNETGDLSLDKLQIGSQLTAFVNNVTDQCLWVNISPNVRGRIDRMEVSDDVTRLQDLEENYPIGSAIRVRVKAVDASSGRLDLTAAAHNTKAPQTLEDLTVATVLPGKIIRVTERSLIVALSDTINGMVTLTELADDYSEAHLMQYNKNDIVRASITEIDKPNKRVFLSLRASKILSSGLAVADPQITSIGQLKVTQVVRGFIKLVRDNGLIVNLGPRVDAFVRVSDLSDSYIKDWKAGFEIDRLVKGKILAVDAAINHVQMSLKESHVDKDYVPPTSLADLEAGEVVTGRIRKVEDFGVFIDVDNTQPRVSGLCHRSQIADNKTLDIRSLFDEGDAVKAKILSIDLDKRRISFGLKASYFKSDGDESEGEDGSGNEMDVDAVDSEGEDNESDEGGIDLSAVQDFAPDEEGIADDSEQEMDVDNNVPSKRSGLKTNGFDWTGSSALPSQSVASDSEVETTPQKKRKRRASLQVDHTGDLDAHGPRSTADYERLLLSAPNDSSLWVQYMAFQLRLSEIQSARDIGQRALRTIHIRESDEKLAIWTALLNLEVSYGSEDEVDQVFKDACVVQEPLEIHERMAEIWTAAGRLDKADGVYEAMLATKAFRPVASMWTIYATWLFEHRNQPTKARQLLSRATQSVHPREHRLLTAKFAAMEFKCANGDAERGRTVFEGLVAEWPRWTQGWDMWVDLEMARIGKDDEEAEVAKDRVRGLFERMCKGKMKKRRAKYVFKRWLEFEEASGDAKKSERVKALAKEYVEGMKRGQEGDEDGDDE